MKRCDDHWQDLGYMIVANAVIEYKTALRAMRREKNENLEAYYKSKIYNLERFFTSQWCYLLCGIEGSTIIKEVQRQVGVNRKE